MADRNKNKEGQRQHESNRHSKDTAHLQKGVPKTSETGAQNNGGQTEREGDKLTKQKHGGHRE